MEELKIGFYWVRVMNDPDIEHDFEHDWMPARYMGDGNWFYMGGADSTDWKPSFIGERIECNGEPIAYQDY